MSQASTTTAELASLDGRIGPADEAVIPATDEGLLRGDGAFEVIRIYDGRPFALTDHLDRLERSASNLRLPEAFRAELETEIPELIVGPRRRRSSTAACAWCSRAADGGCS